MADENPTKRFTDAATSLAMLNAETTAAVMLRQNATFAEMVKASVAQTKALLNAKDVNDVVKAQQDYLSTMTENLSKAASDAQETIRAANESASTVVRTTFQPDGEGTPKT